MVMHYDTSMAFVLISEQRRGERKGMITFCICSLHVADLVEQALLFMLSCSMCFLAISSYLLR